jgi:hypothetical protein
MSHFAKVNAQNEVIEVIVAEQDFIDSLDAEDGIRWIKTSYCMRGGVYRDPDSGEPQADQSVIQGDEARQRKNFASIGMLYNEALDAFTDAQPYASWTINSTTGLHEAPIELPVTKDVVYGWDEDLYQSDNTQGWVIEEDYREENN